MEERDQILIERYLSGDLTEAERNDIELRRLGDPLFSQQIAEYEMAKEALKAYQRDELKKRFQRRDEVLDKKTDRGSSGGSVIWYILFGVLLVGLISWKLWLSPDKQTNEPPAIEQQQDNQELQDSMPMQETPKDEIEESPQDNNRQNEKRYQEIFAENFEPYRDDLVEPTSRGDDLSAIERMEVAYWNEEYDDVIKIYEELSPAMKQNDNLRFMQANAMMAAGRVKQGAIILSEIIRNGRSKFVGEAHWYLALAYLKSDDVENGRKQLEAYLRLNETKHRTQAEKILKEVN